MDRGLIVDGQPRPREPEREIDLLDGVGIDRRLMPQPQVFELFSFGLYYEAGGGWIDTVCGEFL